jgi:integrase/recombinase XerC
MATLHARGLGSRSLARKLSSWRQFYDWLLQQQLDGNPCLGLRAPSRTNPAQGAARRWHCCPAGTYPPDDALSLRDRALFELMYSSGLRLSEAVALDLADMDLAEQLLRVRGRATRPGCCPSDARHWTTCSNGYRKERPKPAARRCLSAARQTPGCQAGTKATGRMGDPYRHGPPRPPAHAAPLFASHLLQSSGDLRAVQELLGHANLSTTQIYTALDFQHLAKVYDAAHPRARKKD